MIQGDVKQFKLTTGEEIVCEVIEWPSDDEEGSNDLVVRRALKILAYESSIGGPRVFMFRPWMVLQTDADQLQTIPDFQIVGEANPSPRMVEQYLIACGNESQSDSDQSDPSEILQQLLGGDSDSKVVVFPGGRTLH